MKLYQKIATAFQAWENCRAQDVLNTLWEERWKETIEDLSRNHLPHGSGFDNDGTHFDFARSKQNRLIFTTSYHHMTECGFYDDWTEHDIIITPDLCFGFSLRITGKDKNNIKDYIGQLFETDLDEEVGEK